jgi:hypothetical protein
MPAIFELLYKEFCRARLAEMRKQLLLTGKHPELLQAAEDPSDPEAPATSTPAMTEDRSAPGNRRLSTRQQHLRKHLFRRQH